MFLSSINTNRKSNMRFPQRWGQENSSGGQALAWGPTLPSPSPSPTPVSLLPLSPSCPFLPSPPLPSSLVPFPYMRSRPPKIQLGGLGERCKLPQRSLKIWHLLPTVGNNLIISSIVNVYYDGPALWLGARFYSGGKGLPTGAGARFPMSPIWTSYVVPKSPMTCAL